MRKKGHQALRLTINEYLEYQKDQTGFLQKLITKEKDLSVDNILFAVNIDTDTWATEFACL